MILNKNTLNLETVARLDVLHQAQRERQRTIALMRDYYNGDHPTYLTERQREFLHKRDKFCMNYCRLVVDAPAERLHITGFQAENQKTGAWLWKLWQAARLDATSKALHLAALRDGEAFLIVDYDMQADRPRFSLNFADDGSGGVTMHYSEDWQPAYAVKRWTVDSGGGAGRIRRMNIYYPDRLEKYISTSVNPYWQPYKLENETWPLAWVDKKGYPLGLPVVHFRNREQGTPYGISEIHDVVQLQDALNKTLIDLLAVSDTNAFPMLVALGFDLPAEFKVEPGAVIQIPSGADARADFKAIDGANVGNLLALLQHLVMEIARVSSTPLSRFQISGQVAAEGTLKQQDAGLIAKVEHKQVTFGNAWEDAMRMTLRLQNSFGALKVDETTPLSTLWSPAAPRSEMEHLQMLLLKAQLGVPVEMLLAEAGYNTAKV